MTGRFWLLALSLAFLSPGAAADGPAVAYRTDSSNADLPWYQLKPGEFPPRGSEHRVTGELVEADFIHRRGTFRTGGGGELVDFKMLPYGTVRYHDAGGDLRDLPLGKPLRFSTYRDEAGTFTKVAAIADDVTADASDAEAPKRAAAEQRKRYAAFIKARGLAGVIEQVDGKRLIVTLFGEPDELGALLKGENIDFARWVKDHARVHAVVADQDLRTYNPPVDGQGSTVLEVRPAPTDRLGCGGVCLVIQPSLLLEGFRRGRVIRIFAPGWRAQDMPLGEGIYTEVPNAKVEDESPNQYPFRTDFGNEDLPWYRSKAGEFPPHGSQHTVGGELVKVDAARRSGQFRTDRSGAAVDFTMPPFGAVMYHNAEAELGDVPLGTHCFFHLHQDDKGQFTRATLIADDFTTAVGDRVTYRIDAIDRAGGTLQLARHLGLTKDDHDHPLMPPDLGRGIVAVDEKTRVWKGDAEVKLADLAVGDDLLVNLGGRRRTDDGRCTEIWAGADAHKRAADVQRTKHNALLRAQGVPAWVDGVEGKEMTVTFFAASRRDFPGLLDGDPWGKAVRAIRVDAELRPQDATPIKLGFKTHLPEGNTVGTYGCSGIRWVLESRDAVPPYQQGQLMRVWKEGWPPPADNPAPRRPGDK